MFVFRDVISIFGFEIEIKIVTMVAKPPQENGCQLWAWPPPGAPVPELTLKPLAYGFDPMDRGPLASG